MHIGNQVDLRSAIDDVAYLLQERIVNEEDEVTEEKMDGLETKISDTISDEIFALVKDRIRRPYREFWNLPHVREVLAHCPNIFVCASTEDDNAYIEGAVPPEWTDLVKNLCKAVRYEYQDMLLSPEDRAQEDLVVDDETEGDATEEDEDNTTSSAFRMWGRTGFFPMDKSWTRNRATDTDVKKLEEALSNTHLQVMIFACAEDALSAIESADRYSALGRAFTMLADWEPVLVPGSNKELAAAIEKKNIEREQRRKAAQVAKALRGYRINKDVDDRLDAVISAHQSKQTSPWVAVMDPASGRFYYWYVSSDGEREREREK